MKILPTVIASELNRGAICVESFEGSELAQDRDAVDFTFIVKTESTREPRRLVVRFRGIVKDSRPEASWLLAVDNKEDRFRMFAEAAIGDFINEEGANKVMLPNNEVRIIKCFSKRFQILHDRQSATEDQVDRYLQAHVLACADFNLQNWIIGLSDVIRLNRPLDDLFRIAKNRQGVSWTVSESTMTSMTLSPLPDYIRIER